MYGDYHIYDIERIIKDAVYQRRFTYST